MELDSLVPIPSIELYRAGHTAAKVDNLNNSNPEALRRPLFAW
jgi:hypothetical protein